MAINAIFDSDGAEGIVSGIFGTIADALRMMGFMLIPIMTFEEVGLKDGFRRMRSILTDNLGGMATIIVTDVEADNGIVHVIDAVVLPVAP